MKWLFKLLTRLDELLIGGSVQPNLKGIPGYHDLIWQRWAQCQIDLQHTNSITYATAKIMTNRFRYDAVGKELGIPFYVIGAIHCRESNFNFDTILANGDPLIDKNGDPAVTVHVPIGMGPFLTWEDAAMASLRQSGMTAGKHWDLVNALENMEGYNGFAYKYANLPSPYIWSFSNQYKAGLYTADNKYDPAAIDSQPGCAVILKGLKALGVDLNEVRPI